ncbi:MAG: TetR family transcriptional regulator C-terminal domain-containing protein [Magnetococcales bacterium]|nr:TetR family transcriptional regulator C-terminal domain-containing protein [Magnetococcales bacterium]
MKRNADQTRERLLEAAHYEIHRKGFQAASLTDILSRAGLTKGAMYHHFANKKALGYAVVEERIKLDMEEVLLRPLKENVHFIDGFHQSLKDGSELHGEDLVTLGCPLNNLAQEMSLIDEGFRLRLDAVFRWWRDRMAEGFRQAQKRGEVRREIDPEKTAIFIQASMEGCVSIAKNAQSREIFQNCLTSLSDYLNTLRAT